ncbi:MAG: vWA domain-containing protein [Balneolaceae bacterium]
MEFQGLQNNLPTVITLLCVIVILIISWLSYSKYESISKPFRYLLSGLRASALLILLFLFLNPYFKSTITKEELPKIAVFYDDSESTSIIKGAYLGEESYLRAINQFEASKPKDVFLSPYSFSNTVNQTQVDSLQFDKGATNLDEIIQYILNLEGYQAAVVFSDGIITYGKNPIIAAGSSPMPIYTIAIGDTSKVRDIAIQNVTTNSTGFTNTLHPVNVAISQYGYGNNNVTVRLKQGNTELQQKNLRFDTDQQVATVNFEIELNEPGLQLYDVIVDSIEGEWITENNKTNFTIDVLESKTRVVQLTSSVHPDVKALKSILSEDGNIELRSFNYFGKWIPEIDEKSLFEKTDLIILQGFPPSDLVGLLNNNIQEIPTLYINQPPFANSFSSFPPFVLTESKSQKAIAAHFVLNQNFKNHAILELPEIDFMRTAPVFTPLQSEIVSVGSEILISANIQGIETQSPLLLVSERGNIRRSELNTYGWYKMYLSNNEAERKVITRLIGNIVNWTAANPDNRLLKVRTSKNSYTVAESPIVNASLINESGNNETNALVELELKDPQGNSKSYVFRNLGNGLYQLELPELPSGKYSYEASAQKNSRLIESQSGTFIVSESSAELANTIRNDELLKGIAERSGGEFYVYNEVSSIWDDLSSNNLLRSDTVSEEVYSFPVRSAIWFILVMALLGSEWLLRKKFSLP